MSNQCSLNKPFSKNLFKSSLLLLPIKTVLLQQQQQKHLLTQIIYKAMIHEYTEYKISKIE